MSDEQTQGVEAQDASNVNADGQTAENQPQAVATPVAQPAAQTFTQADVDRIVGERSKRAAKTSQKELLESLGMSNVNELKALIENQAAAEEAKKSDLQKANEKAQAAQAQVLELQSQLKTANENQAIANMANQLGFHNASDALTMIDRSLIYGTDDAISNEAITEALNALAESKPYLVKAETTEEKPPEKPKAPDISASNGATAQAAQQPVTNFDDFMPSTLRGRAN